MKLLLLILLFTIPALAQRPVTTPIPADAITYTMDKNRALAVYRGDELREGDVTVFADAADNSNRVAVVMRGQVTIPKLRDAIEMAGLVKGSGVVVERCLDSRGEECQRTPRRLL